MRNLSLTGPSTMSNSNALLSSPSSLVLRAPRSKPKATKVAPSLPATPAKDEVKMQKNRALALKALKQGKSWGYFSYSEYSALKTRLNSATDLATIGSIWDEITDKNLIGIKKSCLASDLRCLKIKIQSKRDVRRIYRKGIWDFGGEWTVAEALVMMKDAVKAGIYDMKLYKENVKTALSPKGEIILGNVSLDLVLKYINQLKVQLRRAGHPAYQKGKARRKHISNSICNWYYATPIIP